MSDMEKDALTDLTTDLPATPPPNEVLKPGQVVGNEGEVITLNDNPDNLQKK